MFRSASGVRAQGNLLPSKLERQTGKYREPPLIKVEIAMGTSARVGKLEL